MTNAVLPPSGDDGLGSGLSLDGLDELDRLGNGLSLDDVAQGLQQLRLQHGNPSYQDLATRITLRRVNAGMALHGAKVSRSTIYNAFQLGRARMNADLVAEIVAVLTDDDAAAAHWRQRCLLAHGQQSGQLASVTSSASSTNSISITGSTDATSLTGSSSPARSAIAEHPANAEHSASAKHSANSVAPPETEQRGISTPPPHHSRRQHWLSALRAAVTARPQTRLSPQAIAALIIAGVVVNVLPGQIAVLFFAGSFPLFLDMIGTAIVAITLGPIFGVATSVLTLLPWAILAAPTGEASVVLWLAPVSIIGALVWGLGANLQLTNSSLTRFTLLNVIVGVVCSIVAVSIIMAVFAGAAQHGLIQQKADTAILSGLPLPLAVLLANMFTSIVDKTLSGLIALLVAGSVLRKYAPTTIVKLLSPLNFTAIQVAPAKIQAANYRTERDSGLLTAGEIPT